MLYYLIIEEELGVVWMTDERASNWKIKEKKRRRRVTSRRAEVVRALHAIQFVDAAVLTERDDF